MRMTPSFRMKRIIIEMLSSVERYCSRYFCSGQYVPIKIFDRKCSLNLQVNEILDPMSVNATWDRGILFNATVYFRKGSVRIPSDVYYMLTRYISDQNNYQIGESGLYINTYQPDPFKACWKVSIFITVQIFR